MRGMSVRKPSRRLEWGLVASGLVTMTAGNLMLYGPLKAILFPAWGSVIPDSSLAWDAWYRALPVYAIGWTLLLLGVAGMKQSRNR